MICRMSVNGVGRLRGRGSKKARSVYSNDESSSVVVFKHESLRTETKPFNLKLSKQDEW